jgi:hypothetical protein
MDRCAAKVQEENLQVQQVESSSQAPETPPKQIGPLLQQIPVLPGSLHLLDLAAPLFNKKIVSEGCFALSLETNLQHAPDTVMTTRGTQMFNCRNRTRNLQQF